MNLKNHNFWKKSMFPLNVYTPLESPGILSKIRLRFHRAIPVMTFEICQTATNMHAWWWRRHLTEQFHKSSPTLKMDFFIHHCWQQQQQQHISPTGSCVNCFKMPTHLLFERELDISSPGHITKETT